MERGVGWSGGRARSSSQLLSSIFFSSRRRHTRFDCDWSSDVCSSDLLPPYREEVVSVEMDPPLKEAYKKLEEDVKKALKEHRGNQSVMSVALNALLLYPEIGRASCRERV